MLYEIAKKVLFRLDPEQAHEVTFRGLGAVQRIPGAVRALNALFGVNPPPALSRTLFGLEFPHPVGLAAGLDKDAAVVPAFTSFGFAFIEVGTVTPKPQPGNEKPRLFRLVKDEALINRMGFNNRGAEAMAAMLEKSARFRKVPVAVNIGKNKTTPNDRAADDYRACVRTLYRHADFFVVNVSSPNTPDLRKLQHGDDLKALLAEVREEVRIQAEKTGTNKKAVLVKIAPDLSLPELEQIVDTTMASGVSGIIATNTTVSRDGATHPLRRETGGLSGRPLAERSTEIIRRIYAQTGGRLPIIGCGGVFTAEDAYEKIRAGASLVEVYTAFIYRGPGLMREIVGKLPALLERDGFRHISEAVGTGNRISSS